MKELFAPIRSFIELGGPVVGILLGFSIIALAIILVLAFRHSRHGVGRHKRANIALSLWFGGQKEAAIAALADARGAVNKPLYEGMGMMLGGYHDKEQIEGRMQTVALQELHDLQKGFKGLEVIAQIAPLLGLFGTVLGMIDAFQKLQSAGNSVDPSILAGGIWVALLTTAAGLAVAMPVSMILTFFEARLENETVAIQSLSNDLMADQQSQAHETVNTYSPSAEPGYAN